MKIYLIAISANEERVALTNVTFLRRGRVGRALDRVISLRSREQCQLALSLAPSSFRKFEMISLGM